MDRRLPTPGRIAMHLVVVLAAVVFVRLGLWQLDRLEERRAENVVGESRLDTPPVDVGELLAEDANPEELRYRRVTATGEFDPDHEVLIRSQVYRGNAGFHVLTPLRMEDGEAILVNRGWVPLGFDEVPVSQAPPPTGPMMLEGWLNTTQTRPALGREDPEGGLAVMSRVDLHRIGAQLPYPIAGMYLVEMGESTDPPIPVDPPDFADEGPHLAYAIQWFAFAVIAVVGYYFLLRSRSGATGSSSREHPPN